MVSNHSDSLQQNIAQLIHQQKGILTTRLLTKSFDQIGFDLVDLIDIILAVEKKYQITIPDEVPLNSVADFVSFIQATRTSAAVSAQG
jgi:acyl carrier protein